MIEAALEQAALFAIEDLELPNLDADGFWQPSQDGTVKGQERPDASAVLRVVSGLRAFETFSTPVATVDMAITLFVRLETAPTAAALATYAAPLMNLLQAWQSSLAAVKEDFTVDGFAPAGFRLEGGDVAYAADRQGWTVSYRFQLKGITTQEGEN
jgi:hypothetical protein